MASTASLTALTSTAGRTDITNEAVLDMHAPAKQSPSERVESKPFFSCRHTEDRPAPLSGRLTSSPIHDVSAFGTEPVNEALRTADGKREGAIADKKYKISRMENHA